jgi:hypothetical protein
MNYDEGMKIKQVLSFVLMLTAAVSIWAVNLDGKIGKNEYASSQVLADGVFTLYWQVEGDRIYIAIEALSSGWVAIGLDPGIGMSNADMILGLVAADGKTTAIDAWSTGMFGPHPADTDQGGANSILASAGSRDGDKVVFEFSRLLDTKDKFDKVISLNKPMKVLWATGPSLSSTAKHDKKGSAMVSFGKAK